MKTKKRILMFGWEYPPHISGGLGTACSGLTAALGDLGHDVLFIAPHLPEASTCGTVKIISLSDMRPAVDAEGGQSCTTKPEEEGILIHRLESHTVTSLLTPYLSERLYEEKLSDLSDLNGDGQQFVSDVPPLRGGYGPDLISEVIRYSKAAAGIAGMEHFDIIHGHDWMTILAGLEARRISGKPFILHIHALEWDRAGDNHAPVIFDMERYGMAQADHIVSVSHYTKDIICERYGIEPAKVTVVHNAVTRRGRYELQRLAGSSGQKVVLFLGRITYQKGPEYFVEAAARVKEVLPDVRFVMAGEGDMVPGIRKLVSELGLADCFTFTGFLNGREVEQIFAMSDLYVMPSVSEPFGLAPLEAIACDVPVIISRQSGVSEVLQHVLKVDYWDIDDLAYKIIAVLTHSNLANQIVERSRKEIRALQWKKAALRITDLYRRLTDQQDPAINGTSP